MSAVGLTIALALGQTAVNQVIGTGEMSRMRVLSKGFERLDFERVAGPGRFSIRRKTAAM
jgi:hypothetical protein